ncbi:ABC transporter ATP-binding protein [Bifidobacterium castoris]|uniref:ABC transporter n=1 Tax=Bifidobacterium castoris TaxID=2306972 RepID=A0A430F515_9BIFI|nr:ATP-binding cassette domain-containing protein [Bifidobacterium castoris]RSX46033.1 ABC transporter [Bifidobacterium castoris]
MMELDGVCKSFGAKPVLDHVSFTAPDGVVTGFVGPNGAGKSTTMRILLGLIAPDGGAALVDGVPYARCSAPMASVGAVLDARCAPKNRSAYAYLKSLAYTNNIPKSRVDEVLDLTGLASARMTKAGRFSLGMGQRLAIAAAMLGDPKNLVLDEPVNGLDAEGVKWVRDLCRNSAAAGRAVLLSSHLMSEVALTADTLVIIGHGRVLQCTTVADFVAEHSRPMISVVTPDADKLHAMFAHSPGVHVAETALADGYPHDARAFTIEGADLKAVARGFAANRIVAYRFAREQVSLEQAYMELTHAHAQYVAAPIGAQPPAMPASPAVQMTPPAPSAMPAMPNPTNPTTNGGAR